MSTGAPIAGAAVDPGGKLPQRDSEFSISQVEAHVVQLQKEQEASAPQQEAQPQMGMLAGMLAQLRAEQANAFQVPVRQPGERNAAKKPAEPFVHLCAPPS